MDIDILIDDARWRDVPLGNLVHRALATTFEDRGLDTKLVEVSVLACNDERIAVLNSDFRDKHMPTNVLSWPTEDLGAKSAGESPSFPAAGQDGAISLGDIAISYETCEREASELSKPLAEHVTHLIVHGALHLLGYDHIRDLDATLMQGIEADILGKMGLDDPYRQ